jgi:predicted nucleic acid-binding protein
MEKLPEWVTVKSPVTAISQLSSLLGPGEREAIALIEELAADVLLVDDDAARHEAQRRNIPVQGTLGVLDLAAVHGFLADLPEAIEKLKSTNFRASKRLFDFFLERCPAKKTMSHRVIATSIWRSSESSSS